MAADQTRCLGGYVDGLCQQSTAGGERVLCLGGVEMNGLRVRLCRRGSVVGDINLDTKWTHTVHSNQHRGRLETDDHNKARSPSGLAPLQVEVLSFPGYLERLAVCAVDDPLERLQGTPLGAELPPHRESHAGHRGAGVDEAEDWDALEVELAGDGWSYHTPNRGHLGLR